MCKGASGSATSSGEAPPSSEAMQGGASPSAEPSPKISPRRGYPSSAIEASPRPLVVRAQSPARGDSAKSDAPEVTTQASQPASLTEIGTVEFLPDQIVWLERLAEKYGLSSASCALQRLINRANAEPPKAKRVIFLMVRCGRCLQHTKGGIKKDCELELPAHHWQWLEVVRGRSKHATVGKTLRIIVDFYMPIFDEDSDFERAILAPKPAAA